MSKEGGMPCHTNNPGQPTFASFKAHWLHTSPSLHLATLFLYFTHRLVLVWQGYDKGMTITYAKYHYLHPAYSIKWATAHNSANLAKNESLPDASSNVPHSLHIAMPHCATTILLHCLGKQRSKLKVHSSIEYLWQQQPSFGWAITLCTNHGRITEYKIDTNI